MDGHVWDGTYGTYRVCDLEKASGGFAYQGPRGFLHVSRERRTGGDCASVGEAPSRVMRQFGNLSEDLRPAGRGHGGDGGHDSTGAHAVLGRVLDR